MASKKAFVIMKFGKPFDSIYSELIEPSLREAGFEVSRADSVFRSQNIMRSVMTGIYGADLIVADLTEHNPNVFYELGVAHALGKQVIQIIQDLKDVPFDLRQYTTIDYSPKIDEISSFRERLRNVGKRVLNGEVTFGNPVSDFLPERGAQDGAERSKVVDRPLHMTKLLFPFVNDCNGWGTTISLVNVSGGPAGIHDAQIGMAKLTMSLQAGDGTMVKVTNVVPPTRTEVIQLRDSVFACQTGHIVADCSFPAAGFCSIFQGEADTPRVAYGYAATVIEASVKYLADLVQAAKK